MTSRDSEGLMLLLPAFWYKVCLATVATCIFFCCYYFDIGFDQLWHCCKIPVVRSLGQILGWFLAIKWVHCKRQPPTYTSVSLWCLSTYLLVLPAETINHGFMWPDITDGVILWCWGGWKAPDDPLRSFRPPATYKTSFDYHGGRLTSLLKLGLALCYKLWPHADWLLWAVCLSVFVLQWAVIMNCLWVLELSV